MSISHESYNILERSRCYFLFVTFSIFCLLAGACGNDAVFQGKSVKAKTVKPPKHSEDVVPPEEGDPPPTALTPHITINWLWECKNGLDGTMETNEDGIFTLYGSGQYQIPVDPEGTVSLNFSGSFCPFVMLPRDIIFVIDASSSMYENDPQENGTCGRYNAIKGTLDALPDSGMQFAVVMFSDQVLYKSTKFFTSQTELFAELVKTSGLSTAQDVICASKYTTDYDSPLIAARTLLTGGRLEAKKEIFFISDGDPNIGEGEEIAKELKEQGVNVNGSTIPVTIATIMLNGPDESKLKNKIASRDQDNIPLHARVMNAQDLAKVLEALATNKIVGGEIKYLSKENHPASSEDWMVQLLSRESEEVDFAVPTIDFLVKDAPFGIDAVFTYWDRMGKAYESKGTYYWRSIE